MPIHIIDDETVITEVLSAILSEHSNDILSFDSAEAYLEHMQSTQYYAPRLIITDVVMGKICGFDLIKVIRKTDTTVKIIVMSGFYDYGMDLPDNINIDGSLGKPFNIEKLQDMVSNMLSKT